jgi:hypothetical protein
MSLECTDGRLRRHVSDEDGAAWNAEAVGKKLLDRCFPRDRIVDGCRCKVVELGRVTQKGCVISNVVSERF